MPHPYDRSYEDYENLVRTTTGGTRSRVLTVAAHDDSLTKPQVGRLYEIAREVPQKGEGSTA